MKKATVLSAIILLISVIFAAGAALAASASKPPTATTIRANAGYKTAPLDYTDVRDAEWVKRGFIARVAKGDAEPLKILKADGTTVFDMGRYSYISGDISAPAGFPDTVNPSLWRQAILNVNYGLYEVTSRDFGNEVRSIYQVRGYDIANMSFVETRNGFIVVDVTSYKESSAAAVRLLYDRLPAEKQNKKIHTVIYTHSHIDHYGGVLGVLDSGKTDKNVAIVAPDGFMEASVSENVTAGSAMSSRSRWMYGAVLWRIDLPQGKGQVNNGLAIGSGSGTSGLMPPTITVTQDGSMAFDGTGVEFILAPHTEAPAEMAMMFPDYRSLCLAEICNQTQHNILTPRGAEVRDTIAWSEALDAMKRKWVDSGSVDSAWGPHTWPRWGRDAIAEYVGKQSRMYRYIHDQTVFLMNKGYDMTEIAEVFAFPPDLAKEWFNRGYYGATQFNVKAVYQKYLGWFDNNPAKLWKLPDKTSAKLYAKYLPRSGGSLVNAARAAFGDGEYRWVAEVLDLVRLAPDEWGADAYAAALELQADAFEQMAYSAESGIWRNYFLTGAWRNRNEDVRKILASTAAISMGADTVSNMDTIQILETLSTQINGLTGASSFGGTILWQVGNETFEMSMEDHVIWTRPMSNATGAIPDTRINMTRADLNQALAQATDQVSWLDALLKNPDVTIDGDADLLYDIAGLTHIPAPVVPSSGGGSTPTPDGPSLAMHWDKGGVLLDGAISGDAIVTSVNPDGWLISNLKITRIGDTEFTSDDARVSWGGMTFDIVSNDLTLAVRSIDVTGTPYTEESFEIIIEGIIEKGFLSETITGRITAGEVPSSSSSGCAAGIGLGAPIAAAILLKVRRRIK